MKKISKINALAIALAFCLASAATAQPNSKTSYISGAFYYHPASDTITLTIWENLASLEKRRLIPSRELMAVVKNGKFSFKVDSLKQGCYVSLGIGKFFQGKPFPLLDLYVVEPGDNVRIGITANGNMDERDKIKEEVNGQKVCLNCNSFSFTGKGALKYQYRRERYEARDSLQNNWYDTEPVAQKEVRSFSDMYHRSYSQLAFVRDRQLTGLEKVRAKLPGEQYQLLKTDILAQCNYLFLADMASSYFPEQVKEADREIFKKFYTDTVLNKIRDDIPQAMLARSAFYPEALINKERFENKLYDQKSIYLRLKRNYTGQLRARLLTNYLIDNLNRSGVGPMIADALPILNNAGDVQLLTTAQANSKIGTHLDFSLSDVNGKVVNLSDFKGKVVFLDFWFYGCGGCISFYQEQLSKIEELYKNNRDMVFLTISTDSSKNMWLKALGTRQYTSANAVNLTVGSAGISHPLISKLNILAYPALFVIDRRGNIVCNNSEYLRTSTVDGLTGYLNAVLTKP